MKSQFQQICDDLREDRRDPDRVNAKPVKPGLYLRLWHGRVDPDQEMINLLQYQAAYEANAKIITAVDEMLQTLLAM